MKTTSTPSNAIWQGQIAYYADQFHKLQSQQPKADTTSASAAKPDPKRADFLKEMRKRWETAAARPQHASRLAATDDMDLSEIQQTIQDILNSEDFDDLIAILEEYGFEALTFTAGFAGNLEILGGLGFMIGVAIGIADTGDEIEATAFLTLQGEFGADGGGMFGVAFGLWDKLPENLGGWSVGGAATAEDGIGGSIGVNLDMDGHVIGVYLLVGIGLEDGLAGSIGYTFVFGTMDWDFAIHPVYQARRAHRINLVSLECQKATDGWGDEDEIYLIFEVDDDQRFYYPTYSYNSMKHGDVWELGRSVMVTEHVKVYLFDKDDTSSDDELAWRRIHVSDFSGSPIVYQFETDNGVPIYKMTVELLY